VQVYATSVQGRECRVLRFGQGPVLLLCVGAQHGNELPGREGILQFAQELAADPPEVLETYSVLLVPTANPDGVNVVDRENAAGVDLNRDHIQLTQPESRGMATVLRDRPLVVVDMHLGGVAEDVQLQTGDGYPGVLPSVTASTDDFLAAVTAHLDGEGFTVGPLPNLRLETLLHIRAQLDNTVSVVAEIDTTPAIEDEVRLALELCRGALAYATANAETLASDRAAADATPIEVLDVRTAVLDPAPASYRLFDIPAEHVDGFGLTGVTALSRPVLGYVLDPAAEYSIPATAGQEVAMRYSHTVTYAQSATFRKADHPGLVAVLVEGKGGSGGGAGAAATGVGEHSGGGGGGGGEHRSVWLAADQLLAAETVTVGLSGAGGVTDGANGTSSTFGSWLTAKGGIGGFHLPASSVLGLIAGGEGGYGGTGGFSIPGGAGSQYVGTPTSACGGVGGSSHLGGGGRSSTTTNHKPGRGFGGGGGGAANVENRSAQTGGAGAPGVVRVHVYVSD
jgi:hypothetical protein